MRKSHFFKPAVIVKRINAFLLCRSGARTLFYVDDYDRLIQLCDALASAGGVVDVEQRMADVKRRYGRYPQPQWDKNLEYLRYFGEKAGKDVYKIVEK